MTKLMGKIFHFTISSSAVYEDLFPLEGWRPCHPLCFFVVQAAHDPSLRPHTLCSGKWRGADPSHCVIHQTQLLGSRNMCVGMTGPQDIRKRRFDPDHVAVPFNAHCSLVSFITAAIQTRPPRLCSMGSRRKASIAMWHSSALSTLPAGESVNLQAEGCDLIADLPFERPARRRLAKTAKRVCAIREIVLDKRNAISTE